MRYIRLSLFILQGIRHRKTCKPFAIFLYFSAMTRKFTTQTNAAGAAVKSMSKKFVQLNYELVYGTHTHTQPTTRIDGIYAHTYL